MSSTQETYFFIIAELAPLTAALARLLPCSNNAALLCVSNCPGADLLLTVQQGAHLLNSSISFHFSVPKIAQLHKSFTTLPLALEVLNTHIALQGSKIQASLAKTCERFWQNKNCGNVASLTKSIVMSRTSRVKSFRSIY